ncbi:MAG: glycogen synthase [Deltaproteobacteria bacterium]|nr:glycogen synthase [Deltaproteobacteria bacterium]
MRIAHLSAEVSPFAKTGGLGDVVGALPAAQAELGHEVSVWMPLYRQARTEARRLGVQLTPVLDPFRLELGYESHEVGLMRGELPGSKVPVYFVVAERFFDRPAIYHADIHGQDDGAFRFAVFARAALESMRRLGLSAEVLHAHDWHAALVPMALAWDRPAERLFAGAVSIFTIHNLAFQGIYDKSEYLRLGLPHEMRGAAMWRDRLNLLKGAVLAANAVNTVSPSFAREIATAAGGFDLDAVFRYRGENLVGIVNGIDRRVWNPASDTLLPRRYDAHDLAPKAEARRALLTMAGMDADDPGFLIGLTGRLTEQKGFDLVFAALDDLLRDGIRFVFLGEGEPHLERALRELAERARRRCFGYVGFEDTLAHLIVAGCDAFLMPSRFEPCGLSQLYALAYGTPPIVRRVGGLKDTVVPFDGHDDAAATGFAFEAATGEALRTAVRLAHRTFKDRDLWRRIVAHGMAQDYSWERSARTYLDLYAWQLSERKE